MPAHVKSSMVLKAGEGEIKLGTMKVPGFLRCKVYVKDGENTYRGLATAGFDVEKIQPTTEMPADFDAAAEFVTAQDVAGAVMVSADLAEHRDRLL